MYNNNSSTQQSKTIIFIQPGYKCRGTSVKLKKIPQKIVNTLYMQI